MDDALSHSTGADYHRGHKWLVRHFVLVRKIDTRDGNTQLAGEHLLTYTRVLGETETETQTQGLLPWFGFVSRTPVVLQLKA